MSNVHGFRGMPNNNGIQPNRNYSVDEENRRPLVGGQMSTGMFHYPDPRSETFPKFVKVSYCPSFRIASFIFFITIVDIILYIVVMSVGGLSSLFFLSPTFDELLKFGAKYAYYMRYDYQMQRWIMPMFLHSTFIHIVFNMVSQMITGFSFENRYGPLKTMTIYFGSGIGGILFSALLTNWPSVGASCSIYGLLGGFIALYSIYWKYLNLPQQLKCIMLIFVGLMVLMSLLIGIGRDIDVLGHIGGLFTGFFILPLITPPMTGYTLSSYEKKWKIGSAVFLGIFFILGFTLFYTVRKPYLVYCIDGIFI